MAFTPLECVAELNEVITHMVVYIQRGILH